MGPLALAIVAMFGALIASRITRERSLRLLTSEQKVALVDSFSGSRVLYLVVALGVVVLYILALALRVPARAAYVYALIAPWLGVLAWSHVAVARRLRRLQMPQAYIRTFHRARFMVYGGLGVFLIVFITTRGAFE